MMFRESGKKVHCLRSEYCPEIKRTKAKSVASFDKWLSTAPDEVCQKLEKEEVDQLKDWLSKRAEKESADMMKSSLSHVGYSIRRATEALAVEDIAATLTADQGADLFDAIAELRKALKRAGFEPRKQPKKQAVDKAEGQQPLSFDAGE
jgi:hypothetical protein